MEAEKRGCRNEGMAMEENNNGIIGRPRLQRKGR
jgi:hypothetical protein